MLDDVQKLPDDPSVLKGLLASLASELKYRDILIEKLKHQLVGLRRHQFGSRSETLDQLELTLEEEEIARGSEEPADRTAPAPAGEKRRPKRRPLPDHLQLFETLSDDLRWMITTGRCAPDRPDRRGQGLAPAEENIAGRMVGVQLRWSQEIGQLFKVYSTD